MESEVSDAVPQWLLRGCEDKAKARELFSRNAAQYSPQPIDTSRVRLYGLVVHIVDLLAQNAHETWAAGRIQQGWRWGPTRDSEQKLHPSIVPYEWLSEDEKQYDRNVVNDMLKVIMAVGFILEPCGEQELTAEFGKAPADPNDTYVPKPIPTDKVRVPAELWSLVELLAEHLHESWAKARMEQGWTYGRQRDDANMEHSSLLPYIYLREEEKQYDRGWVTENLKVILRCGFRLIHKTNRTSAPRNLPTNSGTELADSRTAKEEMTEFPAWFIPEDDIASTGSTLDTFDIGTVFLATWKSQTVAIKQIAGRIDSILPAITAFHRLSHPHVIKLFGGIHTRSPPLIVFEFAALGCMREYLQQHPDANKWRLLYEAALGLQFLHENQIVHDDLRLDKILISSEGRAKLSITRLCRGEIPRVRFRWYAPERIYGEPTTQSDVFSLGLCIYEVATGRIPYVEVPTYREMSVMIQDGRLPSRVDGLDEEVWGLIEQLTRRTSESRMDIQNAVDALKKLSARKLLHGDMPKMTVVVGQAISSVSEAVELLRHPSYHDPYCMALKWIRRHMMLIETYSDLVDLGGIPLLRQAVENLNSPFAHRLYAFDALYHINKTVLFEAMTAVIAQLKPLLRHPDEIEVSSLLNRMMDEALGDDRLEAIEVLSIYWAQDMISGDMNFIVQNLIQLLEVDDEKLNAVGAMAIAGLTTSKSTTNSILRGTVRPLLGLLKSNEERRQQCASVALGNLAANSSDNANGIANDGGVNPLLDLLKTGSKRSKECAAYALSHLAADVGEVADEIAASDGVRLLVQLLSMGSNGAKQWAASALGNLAANSHDITVIVEKAGCVGPLVDLIKTGPSGCKECAAYALGRFAEISVAITVSIATAGAVDPLVDLLKTGSHEAKQMAAFALSKIAAHSLVAKRSIIEVGAVEPLVSLVKKGWVGDRRWGAYALGHLAANSPEAKVSITRAGGIGPLVNLVTMGSAEGKLWAAYALANLAANSPRTADTIREAGGINPLLDLLKFGPLAAKERAIPALGHLIACSPKSKTLVAKSGAVGSMVDVLKSGSTVAKERAASVLYQLATIYPGVKIRATKAGAIGILTKLARCETNEDKKSKLRRGARISPITNSSIEKCGVFVSLLEALKAAPLTSVAELETSSNERAARLSESEGTLPSIKNSKPINQDFYSSRLPGRWRMRLLTESKTLELTILSDSPPHRCFHSPIQISLLFRGLEVGRLKRRTELAKAAMQLVFKLGLADGVTFVSTDPGGLTPAETHDLLLTALKLAYEDADVEERIEELSGLQLAIDTKKMGLKWISKNEAGPFMVFMEDGRVWPEMEILTTDGFEAGEVYVIDWELLDGLGQWVAKGILQPKPARLPVFLERILGELYLRITVRHLQPSSSRIQPLTGVPETIIATIALADKIPMPVVFDSIVWDEELNVGLYTVRCRLRSSCGMDDGARFQVYETVSRFALMAAKYGDVSVLMRIPVSCVINIRDSKKRSLLHVAAKHRNPSILKKLLELGIGEHDRDLFGRTAAHYACANGDIVCLDLLMKSGSDPTTVDERGIGLLDIVKATGHLHLLCVLAPYLLGLARNSIPPSHESHARVQRGGMVRRIGGAAISLMGKVTGRGFASRVTPANIPQQGANDRQENVATTTLTGREESDQEDRFVCFHKVCVLGTNADKRRNFINSIVQTSEPFVERAGKYRLSEWAITEFIPNEGLARIHRIFFWDIPSEPDLEVVNTLFFSDPTLFMICVDLRDFVCELDRDFQTSPNDTVFEWIQLVHSRHPGSEIVLVDVTTNMAREERPDAMKSFEERMVESRNRYLSRLRLQRQLAEEQLRSETSGPCRYALLKLVEQLENVNRNTESSGPKAWVKGSVEAKRKTLRAEVIKHKGGYVLSEMHLSVIDAVMAKRDQIAGNSEMESIMVRKDALFRLMQPIVDRAVFDSTLNLLHELSLVHVFDDSRVKVLAEYVCIDMSFVGDVFSTAISVADKGGVLAHKNLQLVSPWSEITDKTLILQLKRCLVATLLAIPSTPQLDWDSDLIVPSRAKLVVSSSAVVAPLVSSGSDSTDRARPQPPPQSTTLCCCRKIIFGHPPPASLIATIVAAVYLSPLHFDLSGGVVRLTSDVFTAQISVRQLDPEQDHACGALVLEAVGKYPTRSLTDRSLFQQIFDAVETVLNQYPGLWVTREDATWMPREWMLEDLVRHNESRERRARAREAIVIDEAMYVDRVCVLGPPMWGKTSLVKSLTSNTPSLEHKDVRTVGVDLVGSCFIETDPLKARGRRHIVTFCDYAGLTRYQPLQALHFPYATLFLICVDLHAYAVALEQAHFRADTETQANAMMNRFVRIQILRWVDNVCFNRKDFELVFAATNDKIKSHFLGRLKRHVENHADEIRERLSAMLSSIENKSDVSKVWVVVSCSTTAAVVGAQNAIKGTIVNALQSKLLPNIYARALTTILRCREDLIGADPKTRAAESIRTLTDLKSWLKSAIPTFASSTDNHTLKLLHDIGEVIRYEDFGDFAGGDSKVIIDRQT